MTISERLYRILLRLYPARYRREYGQPMAQCFRDQLRAAGGHRPFVRLWLLTLLDLVRTVPARRLERPAPAGGLTQAARYALFLARSEASSFSRREIGLEHLLLGILRQDRQIANTLLGPGGVEAVVEEIEAAEGGVRRVPPVEDLRLSLESLQAVREAGARGPIGTRELLSAILKQKHSLAARILRRRGVDRRL